MYPLHPFCLQGYIVILYNTNIQTVGSPELYISSWGFNLVLNVAILKREYTYRREAQDIFHEVFLNIYIGYSLLLLFREDRRKHTLLWDGK